MNGPNHTKIANDFESSNSFAEADGLLAAAIDRIEEGRSNGAAGAVKTCDLLLALLDGAREHLRRLGGLQ